MQDEAVDVAGQAIMTAVENYLKVLHDDETIILTGLVMQASGSGVTEGEVLGFMRHGTKTECLGLRDFLDYHIEQGVFDGQ